MLFYFFGVWAPATLSSVQEPLNSLAVVSDNSNTSQNDVGNYVSLVITSEPLPTSKMGQQALIVFLRVTIHIVVLWKAVLRINVHLIWVYQYCSRMSSSCLQRGTDRSLASNTPKSLNQVEPR